jgi:chorismate dehydratase
VSGHPLRLGAVGYLNARPLTWALDRDPSRWKIRYDVPSACAAVLHGGDVDLGLVPSIEYLRDPDYRIVPGVGVVSRGPVASVALYSRVPVHAIQRIALDTSSRTSIALVKVLCKRRFAIAPEFVPSGPDLRAMTLGADAALLIGDPALEADHTALGLEKTDLGEQWTLMTGLPFVYAAWTGRSGAATPDDIRRLQQARDEGVCAVDDIAREYAHGDPVAAARAVAYLRDNVSHVLGGAEAQGLQLFLDYAADAGAAPRSRELKFLQA